MFTPADVDDSLAPLRELRSLVLARPPRGYGFGPYAAAATGAAWDAPSVAALMRLALVLPRLEVQLERTAPPGAQPPPGAANAGADVDADAAEAEANNECARAC